MLKRFEVRFPADCETLPDGFWSAVDVWIKKPHVVNKRLCGVQETEVVEGDEEEALRLLPQDVVAWLSGSGSHGTHRTSLSSHVRTFIPKIDIYGTGKQKELVVKDSDAQQVTFVPFEESEARQVSVKKDNVYSIKLCLVDSGQWALELHVRTAEAWYSDGVAYPKLTWLAGNLLPKLLGWAVASKSGHFPNTLSLLPVEKYSLTYQRLKDKYKAMVKVWPEVTDPEKFVYEDVAIATYLLVLWSEERAEHNVDVRQSFVDLGCGNGLLVHILANEGHPGKGIDVRKRKIWDMYGPDTVLQEEAITPGENFLFPETDWLIGNHSDELTPWIPIMAARSSCTCRYFVLPCCFFDFFGKYRRRDSQKSQYKEYIDFIDEVSRVSGFHTLQDCLRIPSTKRVCLLGKRRTYEASEEAWAEDRRAGFIRSRHVASEGDGGDPGGPWEMGFRPRERMETVRNCMALSRDLVDGVVLRVAEALLGMSEERPSSGDWKRGGSLCVGGVAALLPQDTLKQLKNECGGLQTLLKNNHQVFQVEGGTVRIRDWRDARPQRTHGKRKAALSPGALKTRPCWFDRHHPQGCPLLAEKCTFAHGLEELRASTRPERNKANKHL
ncbi:putative tRNA (uracil-O(2)-)-methyltransferase isoform X3 [Hippocampus comes]|uniref:tRNA (uracil-O(2)-)-methyltransferase n=1 Tax=Hippocampus comes TaxID=109280 RepID=A0A3Q2YYJ1_HIPCM|nr:PREDICTED: probable tRNA (uracil-O(2)-)-methyltransferase isoform X1 [Hippocampus comes]XP_019726912.1 PREDICTED: probable tRNA (uracil-O(2)-)-methyltransferase isoform X2 [Hippocampus comes]XP_019726913.1 PREDICTED: probable tRNA (uracil-O(2)-)-methyltransferase isoform X3 [Hippocampus comes]